MGATGDHDLTSQCATATSFKLSFTGMSRIRASDTLTSNRVALSSTEKLSGRIALISENSINCCRTKTTSIWRRSLTNGSDLITSPDHMEPSTEKRLTKRSGNDYKSKIRCLAHWSPLQSPHTSFGVHFQATSEALFVREKTPGSTGVPSMYEARTVKTA